eukprot:7378463-Prymnesium_polylepis.1
MVERVRLGGELILMWQMWQVGRMGRRGVSERHRWHRLEARAMCASLRGVVVMRKQEVTAFALTWIHAKLSMMAFPTAKASSGKPGPIASPPIRVRHLASKRGQ